MKNIIIVGLGLVVVVLLVWAFMTGKLGFGTPVATVPGEETSTTTDNPATETGEAEDSDADEQWVASYLPAIDALADKITVSSVTPGTVITSPVTIAGEARGPWYFEASFPVFLNNWDGLTIATGVATAQSDWMTEDFVPFTLSLSFVNPYQVGDPDFMKKGTLILKKDNPSGLPANDASLEVPIFFAN